MCGMKARPRPLGLSLALDEACLSFLRTPNYIKKGLRAKLGVSGRLVGVAELSVRTMQLGPSPISDSHSSRQGWKTFYVLGQQDPQASDLLPSFPYLQNAVKGALVPE